MDTGNLGAGGGTNQEGSGENDNKDVDKKDDNNGDDKGGSAADHAMKGEDKN